MITKASHQRLQQANRRLRKDVRAARRELRAERDLKRVELETLNRKHAAKISQMERQSLGWCSIERVWAKEANFRSLRFDVDMQMLELVQMDVNQLAHNIGESIARQFEAVRNGGVK